MAEDGEEADEAEEDLGGLEDRDEEDSHLLVSDMHLPPTVWHHRPDQCLRTQRSIFKREHE